MVAPTRRAFLHGLGRLAAATYASAGTWVGAAPTRAAGYPRTAPERAWLGLPDPSRHWHGASGIAAPGSWPVPGASHAQRPGPMPRSPEPVAPASPVPPPRRSLVPYRLADRFPDLRRRFVFEYYPWYGTAPWYHWNEAGRTPPHDIAASSMPWLGPYDSYDVRVIEQHARWIAQAGVGAINLSWWGRGDYTDLAVPRVMDVMRDHDIKVTFHLEPYRDDRSRQYADDVVYLLREYGEKRRWDTFLLLDDGQGRMAPVFKSFRTILPREVRDCLGRTFLVPDYTADGDWRRQTDGTREATRRDFSQIYLLVDTLDVGRAGACGFDGLAVYDNFVTPSQWTSVAQDATSVGLLASFNVNPGFDRYPDRQPPPTPAENPCYGGPLAFEPGGTHPDWNDAGARAAAQHLALGRIEESFETTTRLQQDVLMSNRQRGFFLAYVNSFNEWHEGSQFEPARDAADLTDDDRRVGYHNPPDGRARLRRLEALIAALTASAPASRRASRP